MKVDVFSIFPEMVTGYTNQSILGRSIESGILEVSVHDLRLATSDKHRTIDDPPFGGGAGMVLMPEPVFKAVEEVNPQRPLILLGPSGRKFDQRLANELSDLEGFSLLCGRYEGVDERIRTDLCDDEISIGDFVLAGGELAALTVIETVARLQPGVLGNESSTKEESFSDGLLEYPQFTRPSNFRDLEVPEILLSGDHGKIERWRKAASLAKTLSLRPDLIETRGGLSEEDKKLLEEYGF
ncbi:tRNA (guanosine(37)-N1)-methyltransferase TrmD [Acidimicrobiia bacterium]|jgi:tRNA (guanine37-N1)-methyltransferase|nr:tRNA (guanosine(37)-N1)-methyltransferase TrmD [Acidimicrobiia bacterium]|tara:strand:+ start:628 stop:1347 length:720 start_codon:yes stop_codon:yes gene_type:complete